MFPYYQDAKILETIERKHPNLTIDEKVMLWDIMRDMLKRLDRVIEDANAPANGNPAQQGNDEA